MAGRLIPRALVAALWLTALTFAGARLGVNAATMGLLFLVSVLALSAWGGWAIGTASAVGASLAFNYFFLPPFGTFHIADPDNAVAFLALLFASTFSARLMSVSRRRAADALARRQETETLYQLSLDLFANSTRSTLNSLSTAAERTLTAARGHCVVAVHDTTEINFKDRGARRTGLGPAGDGVSPGFFCHPLMLVDAEHEAVLGLVHTNRARPRPPCYISSGAPTPSSVSPFLSTT